MEVPERSHHGNGGSSIIVGAKSGYDVRGRCCPDGAEPFASVVKFFIVRFVRIERIIVGWTYRIHVGAQHQCLPAGGTVRMHGDDIVFQLRMPYACPFEKAGDMSADVFFSE